MNTRMSRAAALLAALGAALAGSILLTIQEAGAAGLTTEECLECHVDAEDEVKFPDGSKVVVGIDQEAWEASLHGKKLTCSDCHPAIVEYPHPDTTAANAREYQLQGAETCRSCHYAYYTRALDGIHYAQLNSGNDKAPVCTDCHGAHAVMSLRTDRVAVDRRCGTCHEKVAAAYASSVHGKALHDGGHPDTPVCTDCHGAHAIADPGKTAFHVSSYTICARCHADEERMEKYGLNAAVLDTYLDDFHGVSNQLYASGAGEPGQPMATCTDCHGIHDIQPFDKTGTDEEMRERVVVVCRRCHEGVPPAFADAWLSHYEPTLSNAPLVWGIKWAYSILIPLIMCGLILHILLHLWRLRARR